MFLEGTEGNKVQEISENESEYMLMICSVKVNNFLSYIFQVLVFLKFGDLRTWVLISRN